MHKSKNTQQHQKVSSDCTFWCDDIQYGTLCTATWMYYDNCVFLQLSLYCVLVNTICLLSHVTCAALISLHPSIWSGLC